MEAFDTLGFLFQKDSYAVIIAIIGFVVSILALVVFRLRVKKKTLESIIVDLEAQTAKLKVESLKFPEKEQKELLEKVRQLESIIQEYYEDFGKGKQDVVGELEETVSTRKEDGFISREFLMYGVPAIIALTFTFALVYLLISNQNSASYQTPEILKTGITTIIGYYFGVAVNDGPTKNIKEASYDDIQKQLDELIAHNKRMQSDAAKPR
ncbi:MAG: hypothetical protein GY931_08820, partial [Maribacter sp.]|nr:hypothetical protein [Maribacter sp.]